MDVIHSGTVARGFQFASGGALGRGDHPSPFSDATLRLQEPHLRAQGIDLDALVPGRRLGTINVRLPYALVLDRPDLTATDVDWTTDEPDPAARIAPETFSFAHCCFCHAGHYYPGLIYYPHPETKPATNAHAYDVLEVIAPPVDDLAAGAAVAIVCRSDAFRRA
jgi:hypothetical protein